MSNVPHNPSLAAELALRKQSERLPCDGLRPGCYTAVLKTHHCNWGHVPMSDQAPAFFTFARATTAATWPLQTRGRMTRMARGVLVRSPAGFANGPRSVLLRRAARLPAIRASRSSRTRRLHASRRSGPVTATNLPFAATALRMMHRRGLRDAASPATASNREASAGH
jgi:hypothetical protein